MDVNDKITAVNRYIEAFEKSDINIIKELYAEDATVEDPVGTDLRVGMAAICEFYEGAFQSGATLELSGKPRCAGNAVAFPFLVKTTDFNVEVIDVFEFNDQGKVKVMRAYWGPENVG